MKVNNAEDVSNFQNTEILSSLMFLKLMVETISSSEKATAFRFEGTYLLCCVKCYTSIVYRIRLLTDATIGMTKT